PSWIRVASPWPTSRNETVGRAGGGGGSVAYFHPTATKPATSPTAAARLRFATRRQAAATLLARGSACRAPRRTHAAGPPMQAHASATPAREERGSTTLEPGASANER